MSVTFDANLRQKQRLFHRRVAAADDDDRLVAEEESVACRTRRNAVAAETLGHRCLAGNAEPFRRSTGRDDQRIGFDDRRDLVAVLAFFAVKRERPLRTDRPVDPDVDDLGAEPHGLLAKLVHQDRAHNSIGEARIIFDIGRDRKLAAGLRAVDDQRLELRPRCVDRGGQPAGPGPRITTFRLILFADIVSRVTLLKASII